MVDHRVTRFQPARRPPRNWGKGMEPALVMLVVTESASDDEEDVSGVVSSSSWSCHSQVLVGGIAMPALARPEGPCWKLASCWSRPSTRYCWLPVRCRSKPSTRHCWLPVRCWSRPSTRHCWLPVRCWSRPSTRHCWLPVRCWSRPSTRHCWLPVRCWSRPSTTHCWLPVITNLKRMTSQVRLQGVNAGKYRDKQNKILEQTFRTILASYKTE